MKRWGKSPPRRWQQGRQGKPHREQDRIGTTRRETASPLRAGRSGGLQEAPRERRPRGMVAGQRKLSHRTRLIGRLVSSPRHHSSVPKGRPMRTLLRPEPRPFAPESGVGSRPTPTISRLSPPHPKHGAARAGPRHLSIRVFEPEAGGRLGIILSDSSRPRESPESNGFLHCTGLAKPWPDTDTVDR